MIELEARSPVGGAEQSLNSTGQIDEQIAHEEKPEQTAEKIIEREEEIILNAHDFG